jgi:Acyl-protein synthetase, LuxE
MQANFKKQILNESLIEFNQTALELFNFQYQHNIIYHKYVEAIGVKPNTVHAITQIPYLPISFFKTHKVTTGNNIIKTIFKSSRTTGTTPSQHYVLDTDLYLQNCKNNFEQYYGSIEQYCVLGLLPSYMEQGDSSLVYMVDYFIKQSSNSDSGIFLHDTNSLKNILEKNNNLNIKTLLIGVTYALIDFSDIYKIPLSENIIVMETGGMKGRKKEMTKHEVQEILKANFNIENIHSEYGMTELLSQSYSQANGIFATPRTKKILIRDAYDPFEINTIGKGAINIIDLANIYSCAFIATQDNGEVFTNGTFAINGRLDNSDIRGCSLLSI